jgi:putative FmdB family regulatory protein
MPLYSYVCDNEDCEKKTKIMEYLVKLAAYGEPVPCPGCNRQLRMLLSSPRFTINV